MKRGELYLAFFPFGDTPGMKLRPVLLLTSTVGPIPEVVVAYISSVIPPQPLPSDILLDPFRPENASMKLKVVSMLRLHKLATLHVTSLSRRLGLVPDAFVTQASLKLRGLLAL